MRPSVDFPHPELADQPNHLAARDREADLVDGLHNFRPAAGAETRDQPLSQVGVLDESLAEPRAPRQWERTRRRHGCCPAVSGLQQRTSRPEIGMESAGMAAALGSSTRAARPEPAARRRIEQGRRHAGYLGEPRPRAVGRRHGAQQALRVGVQRARGSRRRRGPARR